MHPSAARRPTSTPTRQGSTRIPDGDLQRLIRDTSVEELAEQSLDERYAKMDQLLSGRFVISFDDEAAIMKLVSTDPQAMLRRCAEEGALVRLVAKIDDHIREWPLVPINGLVYDFPRKTLDQSQLWSRQLKPKLIEAARSDELVARMALGGEYQVGPGGKDEPFGPQRKFKELAAALAGLPGTNIRLDPNGYAQTDVFER